MQESKASILVHNTKWIYISKVVSQLLSILATVLVIRKLAVDVFGTYNILLNSFVVFEIVALSGVTNVFNRYIPELVSGREFRKIRKFIGGGFIFSFIFFSSLVYMLYLKREPFGNFFNIERLDSYIVAFLLFNYGHFLKIITGVILRALLLHKQVALITIVYTALRTGLYISFLDVLDVNILLYIDAILGFLFLLIGLSVYYKYSSSLKTLKHGNPDNPVTFRRVRRYGLLSFINELGVGIVGKTSDYFIVAALSSPFQVGLYAFAHRIYGIVFQLLPFNDILSVVRPLFFQKFSQKYSTLDFQNMYGFMIKLLIPLYVFPVLYFLFFGKSIIHTVFDPRYMEAYQVTLIVLSSNLFMAFFLPLSLVAQLKERMDILLYSKIVVVFSIIAGIYGMKFFGIMGVAIASLIGNLLKNLFIFYRMRQYPEIRYKVRDYRNYLIILLMLIPFFIFQNIILNMAWLIIVSAGFGIYGILVFIFFHPFNDFEMEVLRKIAGTLPVLKKITAFSSGIWR